MASLPPLRPLIAVGPRLLWLTARRLRHGPLQPGMPWRIEVVRTLTRPFTTHIGRQSPARSRRLFDGLQPGPPPAFAASVTTSADELGGRPATWFLPRRGMPPAGDDPPTTPVLLYLHGGGYRYGSTHGYRELITRLALAAGVPAVGVDYRLAPEHPFPAALDDAVDAYLDLLARGAEPRQVVVAGDSAGGGLALALLVRLRDADHPLPAGAYLLSPWTDLTAAGESRRSHASTDIVDPAEDDADAREYLAGTDPTDPWASPRFAHLGDLPPLLVQVGGAEILLDDATAVAEKAALAGVDVDLHVYPYLFHDFPALANLLPEARAAIAEAGAFIRACVAGSAPDDPDDPDDPDLGQ